MNKTAKALRLYTHTHTHNISSGQKWSKGGSREQQKLAILPRDCEWFQSVNSTTIWEKYGVVIYMH